jgi:hypothetical protein
MCAYYVGIWARKNRDTVQRIDERMGRLIVSEIEENSYEVLYNFTQRSGMLNSK